MDKLLDRNSCYADLDRAIEREVHAELAAEGRTSYPAVCDECRGRGHNPDGSPCNNCGGQGHYELAI